MRKRAFFVLLITLVFVFPTFAQSDLVRIDFPPPSFVVSGVVDVFGAVDIPNLDSFLLEVTDQEGESVMWTPITLPQRQPPADGILGQWDTRINGDGVYRLRVRVTTTGRQTITAEVTGIRVRNEGAVVRPTAEPVEPTSEGPVIIPRPAVENTLPLPVGGQLDNFDDDAVELMRQAGMTWIKWQIPYTIGDASLLDVARDRINYSHENGFFAFMSIKGSKDELAAVGAAEYYPLYAEFVGQIAALQPDAIQIWNEMNLDREWPRGRIDAASYVDLLRQSYESIKAVDPLVRVVTGAPAPTGFFGGCSPNGCDDDRYYFGMASAGAGQYADCIGIHYNEGILPPTSRGGDPRGEYPTYYLPLMLERANYPFTIGGRTASPLCFSELGYLSPDGYGALPGGFAWGANTSVAEQAAWLREAIRYAAETQTVQVDLLIVFNINYERFIEGDPQGGFAIIRPDGSCPACEAIAELRTD